MNGLRPPPPHAYDIAQHWSRGEFAAEIDWGEPACFACGWFSADAPAYPDVTCRQAWERSGLERAHIVPHALNGPNDVDNYLMLCPPCHRDAPDWDEPSVMIGWAKQRPAYLRLQMDRAAGLDMAVMARLVDLPDWRGRMQEALDAHGGLHGTHLSFATFDAAARLVVQSAGAQRLPRG